MENNIKTELLYNWLEKYGYAGSIESLERKLIEIEGKSKIYLMENKIHQALAPFPEARKIFMSFMEMGGKKFSVCHVPSEIPMSIAFTRDPINGKKEVEVIQLWVDNVTESNCTEITIAGFSGNTSFREKTYRFRT